MSKRKKSISPRDIKYQVFGNKKSKIICNNTQTQQSYHSKLTVALTQQKEIDKVSVRSIKKKETTK